LPFHLRSGFMARALIAKDLAAHIEDRRKVPRLEVLAQLLDHVDEDVNGRRRQPRARGHGPRALHRMVNTKDERHRVEQKNGRFGLFCQETSLSGGSSP
jgi:hypothetical protein